jgi:hypothetical protein
MPVMQQYSSSPLGGNASTGQRASASDFDVSRGTMALAQGIQAVGDAGVSIVDQSMRRSGNTEALEKITAFNLEQNKALDDLRTNYTDVNTIEEEFVKQFSTASNDLVNSTTNPYARTALESIVLKKSETYFNQARQIQASQIAETNKVRIERSLNNATNLTYLNPDLFEQSLEEVKASVALGKGVFTPAQLEAYELKAIDTLASAKIQAEISRDPSLALGLLGQDQFINSLDPSKYIALTNQAKRSYQEQQELLRIQQENAQLNNELETGRALFDPYDKDNQKKVDQFYNAQDISKNLINLNPIASTVAVDLAEKTGVAPMQALSFMRSALVTGNVEQQVYASNMMADFESRAPQSLKRIPETQLVKAQLISESLRSGMAPAYAVEYANKQVDPTNKAILDLRKSQFTDINKNLKTNVIGYIEDALAQKGTIFDPTVDVRPEITNSVVSDYLNAYEKFYLLSGNEDVAKENANKTIARNYGVTKVDGFTLGGGRVIKYAPENYYQIPNVSKEITSQWIGGQLKKQVEIFAPTAEEYYIVPDNITAQESSIGSPSYLVMIQNKGTKSLQPLVDENYNAIRFRPNIKQFSEETLKTEQEIYQQQIKEAKEIYNQQVIRALQPKQRLNLLRTKDTNKAYEQLQKDIESKGESKRKSAAQRLERLELMENLFGRNPLAKGGQ